jgi:hypothetical protein
MPPAVLVSSDFEYGDDERFQNMTGSPSQAIVAFNSREGNAAAGMLMGAAIRKKAFSGLRVTNLLREEPDAGLPLVRGLWGEGATASPTRHP